MKSHVLTVILADNPWIEGESRRSWTGRHLPDRIIPRHTVLQPDDRACLVVGPRQAGKSTLIWQRIADDEEPTLYLNCEEPALRDWLRSAATVLSDVSTLGTDVTRLYLDEIQHLDEAGLLLKGLVDRHSGLQILATGSSAFDLEAGTRESLAGRATRHLLLPLSVAEIADTIAGRGALRERRLAGLVARFARLGGYPTIHTRPDPEVELTRLLEAFIIRDASDRFRIRRPDAFRRILGLIASQIGNLCNYSEWAALSGVSNDTVADYVELLEEAYIVRLLRPFAGGKRAELTRTPKAYLLDNGIRNRLFGGFGELDERPDRGAVLENLVFTEIAKTIHPLLDGLFYWRTRSGAEVDFVVQHAGALAACEVKAGDPRGRVSRAARSFIEAYRPAIFWVVGGVQHPSIEVAGTPVDFVRVQDLSAHLHTFLNGGR
jgi:uncharacterized protein